MSINVICQRQLPGNADGLLGTWPNDVGWHTKSSQGRQFNTMTEQPKACGGSPRPSFVKGATTHVFLR